MYTENTQNLINSLKTTICNTKHTNNTQIHFNNFCFVFVQKIKKVSNTSNIYRIIDQASIIRILYMLYNLYILYILYLLYFVAVFLIVLRHDQCQGLVRFSEMVKPSRQACEEWSHTRSWAQHAGRAGWFGCVT